MPRTSPKATAPVARPAGEGLISRRLRVAPHEVVWVRAIVEAYDGLALLYGDGSGVIELMSTPSQATELDALVRALCTEGEVTPLP